MKQFLAISAALIASTMLLGETAARAQGGPHYAATPAAAPSKNSLITKGMLWKCNDGVCVTSKGTSRDTIVCQLAAQRLGTLSAFTAGGQAFDPEALARCNERAR